MSQTMTDATTHSRATALFQIQTRELVRNYSYFVFILIFPFFMMGMFLLLQAITGSASPSQDGPDFTLTSVAMGVFLGVSGVAMTATAGPLAQYRENGTLRILGTTPVKRWEFIVSHLAVRLLVAFLLSAAVILVGVLLGAVPWETFGRLLPAAVAGLAIYLGIGYLLAGIIPTGQLATNICTIIQVLTLFTSGVALPFSLFPSALATTLSWLPPGQFGDLLLWAVGSPLQNHQWWISEMYAVAVGAVLLVFAVKLFRWDTVAR